MGLLLIGTIIIILTLLIDYARDVTKENDMIWPMVGAFFVFGVIIEQAAIHFLGYNAMEMIGQWTIDVWVFDMPIESFYLYIAVPYFALVIYYGFIKGSMEDKLLSPFRAYSK